MNSEIRSFEIKNMFNRYDVKLPLGEKANIFVEENGMGKTTILNCLYYVLTGDFEKLNNVVFDEVAITFGDNERFSISHNDILFYIEEYMENPRYWRRVVNLEECLTQREKEEILGLLREDRNSAKLRVYYSRLGDLFGVPIGVIRREVERFARNHDEGNDGKPDKAKVNKTFLFARELRERINSNILYFPTYRRIEEDMSFLGIEDEDQSLDNELIKFGMDDVEKNIEALLQKIASAAINGFNKMTGVLLKQYINDSVALPENNEIDTKKLEIVLTRIGGEIDGQDKQRIIEIAKGPMKNQKYLFNLIGNLIDTYDDQEVLDKRVKKFCDTCNKYLIGKEYIYDEANVQLGIYNGDMSEPINIQNLSSGEKQIISAFSKLYIEENDDCIILFDEPELSLSIEWQTRFLPDIINSGRCSKLIAVTHSPFIFENELDDMARDMGSYLHDAMRE